MEADIDRASGADLLNLAVDVGPVPMNAGACLILEAGPGFDVARALEVIGERVQAIPRLRQRLVRTPFGCGRPVWIDDQAFDLGHHLRVVSCPPRGGERALLDLAVEVIRTPLAPSRPLWSMTLVTGMAEHWVGLIVSFHHVLSDGIGGLAVLAGLTDDGAASPVSPPVSPPASARPSCLLLAADAWAGRLRALTRPQSVLRDTWRVVMDLRATPRAARSSLNQPTGRNQRLSVVTAPLEDVRQIAHAHGGTINDAVLAAIGGAVRTLLDGRAETIPTLVVSVPVSARQSATTGRLGNQVGVMPISVPTAGSLGWRLQRTASITRAAKVAAKPGASAAVVAGMNRIFARLHMLRWMLDHQHLIHTVVSNMPGPEQPLTLADAQVRAIIPISLVRGNVTVAFTVLSYAGTLSITIAADADRIPDLAVLIAALKAELHAMSGDDLVSGRVG